jgi:hypothetical protein
MNVREAYTNFMMCAADAALFKVLFVLAASAEITVDARINITLRNIFPFLRIILNSFRGSAFQNVLLALLLYIFITHTSQQYEVP